MENKDQGLPSAESAAPPICSCGADMFWAECHMLDCEGGEYDDHDYDPLNSAPGTYQRCGECDGKGGYWVCDDRERHGRAEPRAAAQGAVDSKALETRAAAQGEENE